MEATKLIDVLEQAVNLATKKDFDGYGIKDSAVIHTAIESLKQYVKAVESQKEEAKEQVKEEPKKAKK